MRKIDPAAHEISEEKLASLKENAIGILAEHRRALLNEYPFYGSIAMNLELTPTRDTRLSTAACDGKSIFFDIDFLASLKPEHVKFVLAHEILHAVMAHMIRQEGREHTTFNYATDMEVNTILRKDGFAILPDAILPSTYRLIDDKSAEEYYELLLKINKRSSKSSSYGNSSSGSSSGDSSGNPEENADDPSEQMGGNKDGKLEGQFDKHINKGDNVNNEKIPENVADRYGKVTTDKDFYPEVSEENAEKMREAAITAAQVYERSRGELPEHLKRFVENLTKPEISWKEVLQSFVTRSVGSDPSWSRPNRRFVSSRIYLPSHDSETVKLGVILDTSGSTANDIPKFLAEVNGIVKSFTGYTLTLIQCDTYVHSCEEYNDDNPLDLETTKFTVNGGGGTIIYPAFQHIIDNEIDVDAIVVFTDGYTEKFTADMDIGIPTLWMVTNNGSTESFEFGEVCKFKESK